MRIVWSSDAAQDILHQMREAEQNMSDCLREANSSRTALRDANPGAESKTLNELTEDFEQTIDYLEKTAQELRDLIRQTEKAKERFEDAEKDISGMIDQISTGAGNSGGYIPGAPAPIPTPLIDWVVPKVELMPMMRIWNRVPTPVWLQTLLNNSDFFLDLM